MFVHGSTVDCNHWHEDYINCLKWKNDKNYQAAVTIFEDIISYMLTFKIILIICYY